MARFSQAMNGLIESQVELIKLGSGIDINGYWEWLATPRVAYDWQRYQDYCRSKGWKVPKIRTGWNIYRPKPIQTDARRRACASGNCLGASYPGLSPHGGVKNGRDVFAIDVAYQGVISQAQHYEAARAAGFVPGEVTEAISGIKGGEPWHINHYDPYGAVPAGWTAGSTAVPFKPPAPKPRGLNIMFSIVFDANNKIDQYIVGPGGRKKLDGQQADLLGRWLNYQRSGGVLEEKNALTIAEMDIVSNVLAVVA